MDNREMFENPEYRVRVDFIELRHDSESIGREVEAQDAIEVLIVNNGTLRVLFEDKMYTAKAGQGILINKNAPHRKVPVGQEVCGAYSVYFAPEIISGESEYFYNKYVVPFTENANIKVITITDENLRDESLIDGFNKIIAANMIKKSGYEILTKGYLCTLWMSLFDYTKENGPLITGRNVPSQDEMRVAAALSYISENYSDQITLDDIANHIHISQGECCRCFKRVLLRSPFDYIMEFRIYQALKILFKNPTMVSGIYDLAVISGFNNISYFNKVFKKYTQITPTGFRKLIKEDPSKAELLYEKVQESVNESLLI